MKHLAYSRGDLRDQSRRHVSGLIRRAFDGRTQKEIAERGARATGVSPRQIINYLHCEHDAPFWFVQAVEHYVARVERVARKIEGVE